MQPRGAGDFRPVIVSTVVALAVASSAAAEAAPGSRLQAIEIGNEPTDSALALNQPAGSAPLVTLNP